MIIDTHDWDYFLLNSPNISKDFFIIVYGMAYTTYTIAHKIL